MLNEIVKYAAEHKFKQIEGEYIETRKNGMVRNHYKNLGFTPKEGKLILGITNYETKTCYITNT